MEAARRRRNKAHRTDELQSFASLGCLPFLNRTIDAIWGLVPGFASPGLC
jgi:hypothetical protein